MHARTQQSLLESLLVLDRLVCDLPWEVGVGARRRVRVRVVFCEDSGAIVNGEDQDCLDAEEGERARHGAGFVIVCVLASKGGQAVRSTASRWGVLVRCRQLALHVAEKQPITGVVWSFPLPSAVSHDSPVPRKSSAITTTNACQICATPQPCTSCPEPRSLLSSAPQRRFWSPAFFAPPYPLPYKRSKVPHLPACTSHAMPPKQKARSQSTSSQPAQRRKTEHAQLMMK
jgi:hypothetical protein